MSETSNKQEDAVTTPAAVVEPAEKVGVTEEQAAAATARNVYVTWRNSCLHDLSPDAFARVEAASGELIAAIAVHLITEA